MLPPNIMEDQPYSNSILNPKVQGGVSMVLGVQK